MVVYSKREEDHEGHVRLVLKFLINAGLYRKLSKCTFGAREIELLGYVVSDKGVSMSKSRPNMILDWPEPWSIKDSQQLIGFASFLPSSYPQVLEDRDRHGQHATGGKEQPEESPQVGHAN